MKPQFLTPVTLLLTIALNTLPAFANSKGDIATLNTQLQKAMCIEDWEKSVEIIDKMIAVVPSMEQEQRRELRERRGILQNLAVSRTNVDRWLATFCNNQAATPSIATSYSLKENFFRSIKKLGIPIVYETCEPGQLGAYHSGQNKMIICQNNIESDDKYIETLAHESWHVVQDCVGGLANNEIHPVSTGDPSLFQSMLNKLNHSDLSNLTLYESEDLPYEVEAFAMEKYPDVVLKGLDMCASSFLATN